MTSRVGLIVLFILLGFALLYVLAPILTPFLFAALLAFLGSPWVKQLKKWHVPHLLSAIFSFLLIFILIGLLFALLIPILEKQILLFSQKIPDILAVIQNTWVPWLSAHFGIEKQWNVDALKNMIALHWKETGGVMTWVWQTISKSSFAVLGWITNFLLVFVVTFYLLRDWDTVVFAVKNGIPNSMKKKTVTILTECGDVLNAFFRGQLMVMLCLAVLYCVGLSLTGLEFALFIGLFAGLASIVPYLGLIVGLILASSMAMTQFHEMTTLLPVIGVFAVAQVIEGVFLTPFFIGNRVGLHPVAVIFSILVGGKLFGFLGVLIALPVASVVLVLLRHAHRDIVL